MRAPLGLIRIELLLLLAAVCLIALAGDQLAIRVTPQFVFAGNTIRIRCHVPRDARNRRLVYGLSDYLESERQLDGDRARVTWDFDYPHVPCGAETAYCVVVKHDGSQQAVTARFGIVGCEP